MPENPCRDCRWFIPTAEARISHSNARVANLPAEGGECRRHPPQPSLLHTVFPVIERPDATACGEFAVKPGAP